MPYSPKKFTYSSSPHKKRRRTRTSSKIIFAASAVLICLWGFVAAAAILNGDKLPVEGTSSSDSSSTASSAVSPPSSAVSQESSRTDISSSATSSSSPLPPPGSLGQVPESAPVDDAYFRDAVFIGDSRTEGLSLYSGIYDTTYYTAKGLMVDTAFTKKVIPGETAQEEKMTVVEALAKHSFRKVYIMLGVNELGWAYASVFQTRYAKLVDEIKRLQPDAIIYIQSIMPVTAEKSSSHAYITNDRIHTYNDLIQEMCREKGVYYLNVAEAVMDSSGELPADGSTDGVHLKPSYCKKWLAYLKNHALG